MIDLLNKCIKEYKKTLPLFEKMDNYYRGNTDAINDYKIIESRANNKINVNYIKKFIKEEVSYAVGNKITYISRNGNEDKVQAINNNIVHWSERHEQDLLKNALKFGYCYELYYINSNGEFSARVLNPLNSYALELENGEVKLFMHFFSKKFDDNKYMDLYLPKLIQHYKINNDELELISEDTHIFNKTPVSICSIAEEREEDTLFNDIKSLQDAYEVNLSDISSEISDFRNAYLVLLGCDIEDDELEKAKKLGAFKLPTGDKIDVKWLIKNINDTFIQNTLSTIEDKIYQISNHINTNEKLQSNTSSLALRTRLISLENKVKLNCDALADCIKNRLKFLTYYLAVKEGKEYDFIKEIKIKFTPMIPSDDLMMAQILSQAGDRISTETGIAQFSFIDNPKEELEKRRKEQESEMFDLDKIPNELIEKNNLGDE